jgi:hypothetical protein
MATDDDREKGYFDDLVPTAKQTLHQLMTQGSEKVRRETSESILDRAGHTKKAETRVATQIVITNSQVALLAAGADEVEALLTKDPLPVLSSKEFEHGET